MHLKICFMYTLSPIKKTCISTHKYTFPCIDWILLILFKGSLLQDCQDYIIRNTLSTYTLVLCAVALVNSCFVQNFPSGVKTFSFCLDGCLSMWKSYQLLSYAVLYKMLQWDAIIPCALEEMIIKRRKYSFRIPEHGEVRVADNRLTSRLDRWERAQSITQIDVIHVHHHTILLALFPLISPDFIPPSQILKRFRATNTNSPSRSQTLGHLNKHSSSGSISI